MNTTIPGAEYAPTINLGIRPSTLGDWEPVERRLSCSDPDDMRAIWRRAALALGATEEEALHADLHRHDLALCDASDPCKEWCLDVREWCGIRTLARFYLTGCDDAHATGALCRAVWGPQ